MKNHNKFKIAVPIFLSMWLLSVVSCKKDNAPHDEPAQQQVNASIRLESLPSAKTGITFTNQVNEEGMVNIFTWHFLYNGAGVAAGDINNDGLPDLYFCGNMVPDKLYLNKGNFQFEDITANAGISTHIWSSGVTMADVNADGLLDIYVCKNSPTGVPDNNRNKLYINQGKNVFREQAAQYGIDDTGFGVQSTFFDADQDGDLDMYLVNQPFDEFARLVNRPEVVAPYPQTDRFFFFENGRFVDKTEALGMQNARYGLNVVIADFDLNGWTDLYVCNDYHHGDHLYMNQEGRFRDEIHDRTGHTSFYSMGSDVGDINADGWPDLFTLDMAFEDHFKSKTNMGSMDPDRFWYLVSVGQHYQYMQNALQVNQGHGFFTEMAQVAGLSKSDWSYSTLMVDLDHDADQDIMITNGILRDLQNNDFNTMVKERYKGMVGPENYLEVLRNLPSNPVRNILFANDGQMNFSKLGPEAGFDTPGFSHGMTYADLDGDGLCDVVINNMNAPASIYKNASATEGHFLQLKLEGSGQNTHGLGTTVIVYAGGRQQVNTMQTTRGYFSSVEPILHFGLGSATKADSIKVIWNHKAMTILKDVTADQTLAIRFDKEKKVPYVRPLPPGINATLTEAGFVHQETLYDDYASQVLLPYKESQNGPHISTGDVNGDGREDYFIGGAAGSPGAVMLQSASGTFETSSQPAIDRDRDTEDQESVLFDVDGDTDLDLMVVSGSNELKEGSHALRCRLYLNDGRGLFSPAGSSVFPSHVVNGQAVEAFDADGDQDLDLFIGGRMIAGQYAVPASSTLWINQGGKLINETSARASFLEKLGMVTDAIADDTDRDGDTDLIITGEWMIPVLMVNDGKGNFTRQTIDAAGAGLWWTIEKGDFDGDGDSDFVLGNLGWNNKFGGSHGTKLEVYSHDLDQNGDFDVVLATTKNDQLLPVRGRECSSEEVPAILEKFPTYESYAKAKLTDIYPPEALEKSVHLKLSTMSSIWLRNEGQGTFTSHDLPVMCQSGPLKAIAVEDVNGDGHLDFVFGGNHLPTEVETARYDGLYKGVCLGDGRGGFSVQPIFIDGRLQTEDIRDIRKIRIGEKEHYLIARNHASLVLIRSLLP